MAITRNIALDNRVKIYCSSRSHRVIKSAGVKSRTHSDRREILKILQRVSAIISIRVFGVFKLQRSATATMLLRGTVRAEQCVRDDNLTWNICQRHAIRGTISVGWNNVLRRERHVRVEFNGSRVLHVLLGSATIHTRFGTFERNLFLCNTQYFLAS